jgi:hypothetical protein
MGARQSTCSANGPAPEEILATLGYNRPRPRFFRDRASTSGTLGSPDFTGLT